MFTSFDLDTCVKPDFTLFVILFESLQHLIEIRERIF